MQFVLFRWYQSCSEAVRRTSSGSCLPRLTSVTALRHCTSDFPTSLMVSHCRKSHGASAAGSRLKGCRVSWRCARYVGSERRTRAPLAGPRAAAALSQVLLPSCERSRKAMSKPKGVPKGKGIVKGRGRPRDGTGRGERFVRESAQARVASCTTSISSPKFRTGVPSANGSRKAAGRFREEGRPWPPPEEPAEPTEQAWTGQLCHAMSRSGGSHPSLEGSTAAAAGGLVAVAVVAAAVAVVVVVVVLCTARSANNNNIVFAGGWVPLISARPSCGSRGFQEPSRASCPLGPCKSRGQDPFSRAIASDLPIAEQLNGITTVAGAIAWGLFQEHVRDAAIRFMAAGKHKSRRWVGHRPASCGPKRHVHLF